MRGLLHRPISYCTEHNVANVARRRGRSRRSWSRYARRAQVPDPPQHPGRAPTALRYPAQGGVSENTAGTDVPTSRFALPQRRHHHCHQRHVVGGLVVVVVDRIVVDVVAGTVVDVVAGTVVDVVGTVTGGSMGVAVANRALAR